MFQHAPSDVDGISPAETLSQLSLLTEDKQHLMWSRVQLPPGSIIPPRYLQAMSVYPNIIIILCEFSLTNIILLLCTPCYFDRRSGAASVVVKGKLYMFGVSLFKHHYIRNIMNLNIS